MNSKKYSCSISAPLIVENIKRFWVGSILALISYIIVCIVPIMSGKTVNQAVLEELLFGYNIYLVTLITAIPVCAAILIYRYLHQQSSTAIVHSMPYSRKQLFNSSYISGVILCLIPIIITGIIMAIISVILGPVIKVDFNLDTGLTKTDIFTIMNILQWTAKCCILTLAVFTLSVFSAMLTGSTLIQLMLSIGCVFIFPIAIYLISGTAGKMLFGYTLPEWTESLWMYTSPAFAGMIFEWKYVLCQLVIAFVIYWIAFVFYKRRNLEKAADTLVMNASKPIIKYLLTFLGMCSGALFLSYFSETGSLLFFFIGAFCGALIVYIGVDMLIQRSFRIRGFIRGFGIYLAGAVVMFGLLAVDIAGFETKIPDIDDVKGVSLSGISDQYYDCYDSGLKLVEDKEIISEIEAYHKDIIDDKDKLFEGSIKNIFKNKTDISNCENVNFISFTYVLKNGREIKREYTLPYSWSRADIYAQRIVESEAYKNILYPVLSKDFSQIELKSLAAVTSYEGDIFGKQGQIFYGERMIQLMDALKTDIKALKYNEMSVFGICTEPLFTIEVRADNPTGISPEINKEYYEYYGTYYEEEESYNSFEVNSYYYNTINLLNEWGVYDSLAVIPDDIEYAEIQKEKHDEEEIYIDEEYSTSIGEEVTITDPSAIAEIFYCSNSLTSDYSYEDDCFYEIKLYPKVKNGNEGDCVYRYFDGGKLPDSLKSFIQ